mgnify:CR=1 FL=1
MVECIATGRGFTPLSVIHIRGCSPKKIGCIAKKENDSMKKSRPYIWYMLPGLIFYTAFMILPIFLTALISLTGFNGVNWNTLTWVGGGNYVKLFTDPSNSSVYWNALINNLKFIAVEYIIIIPIQLLVSYAFYRKIHFHNFLEGVFLPALCFQRRCHRFLQHHRV